MPQPPQRSSFQELLRITGIAIEAIPRGVRIYLLLLATVMLLVNLPELPARLRSDVLPLAFSSALGIGDVQVLPVVPEPSADGAFVLSLSYRLHNRHDRAEWRNDDACVNARPGFLRAGHRRIRIATQPARFWDSLDGINVHGLARLGGDCTQDALPGSDDILFLQQNYPPGDDLLYVGAIVPEGDHWRTAPGWGVAHESDPRDLLRASSSYLATLLFDVVLCLLSYVVMGLVLFYGRENRLVRWGAAKTQTPPSTDG
jgi:hypothetical protein